VWHGAAHKKKGKKEKYKKIHSSANSEAKQLKLGTNIF